MSAKEAQKEIASIRKTAARVGKSPDSVRAFLVKHKILTANGELAKRFRA